MSETLSPTTSVPGARNGSARTGPKLYNLFPLLAGPVAAWKAHLPRIAEMGFDWVFVNPFHETGGSGSLYAVKDHYRLNPLLAGKSRRSDDAVLRDFVDAARDHGLDVMMDLVVNHTARDSKLVQTHPHWYVREADGSVRSPQAIDPADATKVTVWGDLAEIDYSERPARDEIVAYWCDVVRHYAGLGFRGFRCDAAYKVPAEVWRQIVGVARAIRPDAVFAAETLGCRLDEVYGLGPVGFDYLFNSAKWWDFEADWLLEQYEAFRHLAPSIAFPESHDTERLAAELESAGAGPDEIEACYRQRYLFAAVFSTGVMMPMGYEYGFGRRLDVVRTRPEDWEAPRFDLSAFIAAANRMKADTPTLNEEGVQRRLPAPEPVAALLRLGGRSAEDTVLTVINRDRSRACELGFADLALTIGGTGKVKELTPDRARGRADAPFRLAPLEVRVFRGPFHEEVPTRARTGGGLGTVAAGYLDSVRSRSIVIQNVYPELDCGRFPVKREAGDELEVWADIFTHGHDKIAAVLCYRRQDQARWSETPMRLVEPGVDRWRGVFRLQDNARYVYTIEAWTDAFESWRAEVGKKRAAGQSVDLDLREGRDLVADAETRAGTDDVRRLRRALAEVDAAADENARAAALLSEPIHDLMARLTDRSAAVRYDHDLQVVVDRPAARFAAWYEMFPRSQGTEPGKSATFRDCEARLPEIREMGFDVVYLVPIHPIGRINRKGPNNALRAGPHDPGSPYAIGAREGGHFAIHPELGTLDDFRRFVRAARAQNMEVALDFAIQCSPDHPWIREHPEWFKFRPDGTVKYAENPPKKYQDIVNVNFYGPHQDELWRELYDVIMFWVEQGVTTFRVDNPHTKPIPLWEWLIREVQSRHPEVVFLSEAFTRPPLLKMLAKVGFSQSYTYFTWRNFKGELIEYLTELAQSESKEYLRPNFFTNTPDILPPFLQRGGRPAFRIRLVLAATLSSLYGIYNGFELCENRAVAGTEEYADSEKYQYKVWDWDRPGNIKDYIARINRLRRENPALHEFENLRFHPADSEDVLFYGKMTPTRDNLVFVAVSLDPFEPHESDIVFPLAEMGVPEDATFEVEELLSGAKHLWRGPVQRIRLEPESPAAIYRVTPWEHVDFHTPSF